MGHAPVQLFVWQECVFLMSHMDSGEDKWSCWNLTQEAGDSTAVCWQWEDGEKIQAGAESPIKTMERRTTRPSYMCPMKAVQTRASYLEKQVSAENCSTGQVRDTRFHTAPRP